jgi:hypothetical protein
MAWETFHNKWIRQFKPDCNGCGSRLYVGEGFALKVKGQIVGYCSSVCREENLDPADEDPDWDIWRMHPPVMLLGEDEEA